MTPTPDRVAASPDVLELRGLGKRYGEAWALRDVTLTVEQGRVLALLGENGAGKSTLVKILSGVIPPTEGTITRDGRPLRLRSPAEAHRAGIALIPQELAYVPDLTVAENMVVGRWPATFGLTTQRRMVARARAEARRVGFDLPLRRHMSELSLAERQLVEIAKILALDAATIVLDEPTSALDAAEAERLLGILETLVRDGRGLVYVSHRLEECRALADRFAVLRNGRLALDAPSDAVTFQSVIEAMVGVTATHLQAPEPRNTARETVTVLSLRGWTIAGRPPVRDLDLDLGRGEVAGLFGAVGSGVELVAGAIAGQFRPSVGALTIGGTRIAPFRDPRQAARRGVAYVPAERKTDGLALNRTVRENVLLMTASRWTLLGLARGRAERRAAAELCRAYDVRLRDVGQTVGELSGGNQQKVLLASRIAAEPKVLVLCEPTRGVDIGARAQIHALIARLARDGMSILLVTSDLEEAVEISDRLLVMREGRLVADLRGEEKTQPAALTYATTPTETVTQEVA